MNNFAINDFCIDTLLDVVAAAHKLVDADRVSTFPKIDEKRTRHCLVEHLLGRRASI